ncbi:hypothetical protein GCM10020218_064380 [Dactylosporangium vinaceum]
MVRRHPGGRPRDPDGRRCVLSTLPEVLSAGPTPTAGRRATVAGVTDRTSEQTLQYSDATLRMIQSEPPLGDWLLPSVVLFAFAL